MRRLTSTKTLALFAAGLVGSAALAQDSAPVFPWPQQVQAKSEAKAAATRDPTVRKASLVEALDHKKKLVQASETVQEAKASQEAVLLDEPTAPVRVVPPPAAPMTPAVDPTLAPAAPPPVNAAPVGPIIPIPTSAHHKAVPGPVVIQGPVAQGPVGPTAVVGLPSLVEAGPPVVDGPPNMVPDEAMASPPISSYIPSFASAFPGCYGEVGAVALQRITRHDSVIWQTRFDGVTFGEVNSRDFTTGFEPGARVVLGCPIACGWYVESAFAGIVDWSESRTLNGALADSISTFPALGTFNAAQATLHGRFATSEIDSKYAISIFPTSYLILGLRNFYLEDRLTLAESGTVNTATGSVGAAAATEILARNWVWGPQVGFETRWGPPYGRFSFDSFVKAGVGWNWEQVDVARTLSNSAIGPVAVGGRRTDRDGTAWVEVMTAATFRPLPRVAVRGGWHFMSVWNFASAPLQHPWGFFDSSNGFWNLDSRERAFFQGPFASIEFTWGGLPY